VPLVCEESTLAQRQAAANCHANLAAMAAAGWPEVEARIDPTLELVFGRDGSLTAIDPTGRFAGGCSVPTRAARAQLAGFTAAGGAVCLLAPNHAADVRAMLDALRPEQALIVLTADPRAAALLLHCDDFSAAITRNRLWLVIGSDWTDRLRRILLDRPGLAIPTQFVRLKSVDAAAAERLIAPAQQVFAEVAQHRASELARLAKSHRQRSPTVRRVCVVGGTRFRLWNDGGFELSSILRRAGGLELVTFDVDDPLSSTPLALASQEPDAIVSVDVCRGDAGAAVGLDRPWIAWLTRPRAMPEFATGGAGDRLIVVDQSLRSAALACGWPEKRVLVAGWPDHPVAPATDRAGLALIANVPSLDPPAQLDEFSSHRLLWEWLASQMQRDPLSAFDSAEDLVSAGAAQLGIDARELPVARYLDDLIRPAYAIGVATILFRADLPLKLYGEGWDRIESLAPLYAGAARTREQFRSAVAGATAVVHPAPRLGAHAIDGLGVPVVRLARRGQRAEHLIAAAKAALTGRQASSPSAAALSVELIRSLLA
jgi:hypothetical protein